MWSKALTRLRCPSLDDAHQACEIEEKKSINVYNKTLNDDQFHVAKARRRMPFELKAMI